MTTRRARWSRWRPASRAAAAPRPEVALPCTRPVVGCLPNEPPTLVLALSTRLTKRGAWADPWSRGGPGRSRALSSSRSAMAVLLRGRSYAGANGTRALLACQYLAHDRGTAWMPAVPPQKIGRASWRERVCQYG